VQEVEVNAADVSVVRRNMAEMKNPPHVPEGSFERYLVGQDVLRTGMCCACLSRDGQRAGERFAKSNPTFLEIILRVPASAVGR
jgi:hypothetical protein